MVKSMKPGKQRKAHFNAAMHVKRKRLSARLQLEKPDSRFDGVRTVTVRVGDTVKVVRGDLSNGGKRHGGKRNAEPLTGSVIRIDSNKGRLYIEGAKASKSDNKEEAVPVNASNVVVVRLDETDKYRVQQLTGNRS
ncbi:MAG: 50S ribosomal protein L24 [Candidatus Poseidoniaceae archaeon]|nr:50S ribosomal protein L24 [Candidatus Poseidoniaceae archaeon]MBL6895667.1 50S ribosomal protein L24 [Candidatus Poseidoniaceae archaeon]